LKLAYKENSADAIVSANSQTVNYPVSNVLDSRLSRIYKTDSTTTAEVVFDMGSAVACDVVYIARHNITSSATVSIQANSSDSWTSPPIDLSITHDSGVMTLDFTSSTYRYWRVKVVDATNPDGDIYMGRIWIGEYFQAPGISPTVAIDYVSTSIKSVSVSGQSYMDKNYAYHNISIVHPILNQSDRPIFENIIDTVDIGIPFFVTFDEECSDLENYYVTMMTETLRFTTLTNPLYYTLSYNLTEEI
jgi:hypothetical protein